MPADIIVEADETLKITETTRTRLLSIADGGALAPPDGHALTVTVDGVEAGSVLNALYATATTIAPGSYRGDVVIAVTEDNEASAMGAAFYLRQAAYIKDGVLVPAKSVPSAIIGELTAGDVTVRSTGEAFTGFYVAGGDYTLLRPRITLEGNGRSDFTGHGAAIVATGRGTRLVVDGARIRCAGMMRAGMVALGGARVIVKNSDIQTVDGTPPDGYAFILGPEMMSVPWMLGLAGNVRASVALGDDTRLTYIGSRITSSNWGALSSDAVMSTDLARRTRLTTINCDATITGEDGYGAFADANADCVFLGTWFTGVTHGAIVGGGSITLGDSTRAAVIAASTELELGLTNAELAAIEERPVVISSRRYGVMFHQFEGGSLTVTGATVINSSGTLLINKAVKAAVAVDGSRGARLAAGNGVLYQLMESDDPVIASGDFENVRGSTYTDPVTPPVRDPEWDTGMAHDDDATAVFTGIELRGDFYNGMRGGKNLVLTFDGSRVEGVISASVTRHTTTISEAEYRQISEVSNTVEPAVNNGVIVTLTGGAHWTVTATSYLTSLTVAADATVTAGSMTVDGVATGIVPGTTYTGAIILEGEG